MNTIYIIESGMYSDYYVSGFCTTKERAQKVCALLNGGNVSNDYRYSELDCLDEKAVEVSKIFIVYQFLFKSKKRSIGLELVNCDCTTDTQHENTKLTAQEGRGGFEPKVIVKVWLEHKDDERAKKIAYDKIAEYLASINLIS